MPYKDNNPWPPYYVKDLLTDGLYHGVDEHFDLTNDYMHGPLEPVNSQDPRELEMSWDDYFEGNR